MGFVGRVEKDYQESTCVLLGVPGWTNVTIARSEDMESFWSAYTTGRLSNCITSLEPASGHLTRSANVLKKMDRGLHYGIATKVQNLWKSGRGACQYASIAIARQVADEKYTYTHTLHETRPASTDINQRRTEIVGSRIQEHAGNVSLVCIDRNDGDI